MCEKAQTVQQKEEVVHCGECRYWKQILSEMVCSYFLSMNAVLIKKPEGYCDFGERK